MMWAKDTYDRTRKAYKGVVELIFKRKETALVVDEMLIIADFLKRDLSKRQQKIIIFIYTLSFPFGKRSAKIPNLKDFNLCGVDQKKIREELDKLVELNIIKINEATYEYSIKDPRDWEADYHNGLDDKRFQDLIRINLEHSGVDITDMVKRLES